MKAYALLILPLAFGSTVLAAQEPEVTFQIVQTPHPSSFMPLFWVQVRNASYTPFNLAERMAASDLLVDGKPFKRSTDIFQGPPGLSAQGQWEGCLPLEDYSAAIAPGKHQIRFEMGGAQSDIITVRWPSPFNWRKGNMKSRLKEVKEMAASLKEGLPRECAEEWLTVKDGGVQAATQVRYYVEPQIKVVVPYAQAGGSGLAHDAVSGPVQVYQEPYLKD